MVEKKRAQVADLEPRLLNLVTKMQERWPYNFEPKFSDLFSQVTKFSDLFNKVTKFNDLFNKVTEFSNLFVKVTKFNKKVPVLGYLISDLFLLKGT